MNWFFIGIGIFFVLVLICIIIGRIRTMFAVHQVRSLGHDEKMQQLNEQISPFGFLYDEEQDIFYAKRDAWQREAGYCRLFDESAMAFSMVIDCEPVYFEYAGKLWLMECWKGQYGMTTGAEIGVYNAVKPADYHKGDEKDMHYNSASDEELMNMRFVLKRKGRLQLSRCAKHWWLTAFDLGVFSYPGDLSMCVQITFPNERMCMAYYGGLLRAGYSDDEITLCYHTLSFPFDRPRTPQPVRSCPLLRSLAQQNNRRNCRIYEWRTRMFETTLDKVTFVRLRYPLLARALFRLTKWKKGKNV